MARWKGHYVALQAVQSLLRQLCCDMTAASDNMCGDVPIQLHLYALKFAFLIIFTCHEIFFGFFFHFFTFQNVKTILSSWAVQRQAAGQIWPPGHSLASLTWGKALKELAWMVFLILHKFLTDECLTLVIYLYVQRDNLWLLLIKNNFTKQMFFSYQRQLPS